MKVCKSGWSLLESAISIPIVISLFIGVARVTDYTILHKELDSLVNKHIDNQVQSALLEHRDWDAYLLSRLRKDDINNFLNQAGKALKQDLLLLDPKLKATNYRVELGLFFIMLDSESGAVLRSSASLPHFIHSNIWCRGKFIACPDYETSLRGDLGEDPSKLNPPKLSLLSDFVHYSSSLSVPYEYAFPSALLDSVSLQEHDTAWGKTYRFYPSNGRNFERWAVLIGAKVTIDLSDTLAGDLMGLIGEEKIIVRKAIGVPRGLY